MSRLGERLSSLTIIHIGRAVVKAPVRAATPVRAVPPRTPAGAPPPNFRNLDRPSFERKRYLKLEALGRPYAPLPPKVHSAPKVRTPASRRFAGSDDAARGAGELPLPVRQRIRDPKLTKEARKAGKSEQRGLDQLTNSLVNGNVNPGLGTKPLKGMSVPISELRHNSGARVYFMAHKAEFEIVAKSTKHNQDAVIRRLREVYGAA